MSEEINNEMMEAVGAAPTEETAGSQGEEQKEAEKKYTDEDVDRIISKKNRRREKKNAKAVHRRTAGKRP